MTKRTQLFLAALVLVAILAHGYIYWWAHNDDHGIFDSIPFVKTTSDSLVESYPLAKPTPTIKPKPQTPAAPAVEMREYTDSQLKFSLQHPAVWQVSRTDVGGKTTTCFRDFDATGPCPITIITSQVAVGMNMEAVSDQYEGELRNDSVKRSEGRIAGEEAIILTASGGQKVAVFEHDNMVYVLVGIKNSNAIFDSISESLSFY